ELQAGNEFVRPSPPSALDGRLGIFIRSRIPEISAALSAMPDNEIDLRATLDDTSNSSTRMRDGSSAFTRPQTNIPAPTRLAMSAAALVDFGGLSDAMSETS